MGTCTNHPDRETGFRCSKYEVYLCEECLQCRDPKLYCKHRPACTIAFLEKSGDTETASKSRGVEGPGGTAANKD